jgi:hypothetical protein
MVMKMESHKTKTRGSILGQDCTTRHLNDQVTGNHGKTMMRKKEKIKK